MCPSSRRVLTKLNWQYHTWLSVSSVWSSFLLSSCLWSSELAADSSANLLCSSPRSCWDCCKRPSTSPLLSACCCSNSAVSCASRSFWRRSTDRPLSWSSGHMQGQWHTHILLPCTPKLWSYHGSNISDFVKFHHFPRLFWYQTKAHFLFIYSVRSLYLAHILHFVN